MSPLPTCNSAADRASSHEVAAVLTYLPAFSRVPSRMAVAVSVTFVDFRLLATAVYNGPESLVITHGHLLVHIG